MIVRKQNSFPTSLLDGITVYNSTGTSFSEAFSSTNYYAMYSYDTATHLYSTGVNASWGALVIYVYDENGNPLTFDVFISDKEGVDTYESYGATNPLAVNVEDVPYGDDTTIHISANVSYKFELPCVKSSVVLPLNKVSKKSENQE